MMLKKKGGKRTMSSTEEELETSSDESEEEHTTKKGGRQHQHQPKLDEPLPNEIEEIEVSSAAGNDTEEVEDRICEVDGADSDEDMSGDGMGEQH
ncbi:hypothetical protein HYDPIDRAFT_30744 [Hydnomerulius pinastri MD-312]|uniref:Uncharacterized protein n=1 Tax=Hydnomerulius pinastri MD-312 TaxID=994086 RepID=A0A0C9V8C0_9AGAM|nr:hypothetical protein HYDPIDRAFT_30744 [Hydnomerulius pinastri MD-312]